MTMIDEHVRGEQNLREADDWNRYAKVAVQEQLCARMEAHGALEDPEAVARQVHELQEQWRAAADVPRAQADALWRRFKAAHDAVWPRCDAHFAAQAQLRTENLARKVALCESAESLSESTQWIQTAEALKKLQAEWKTIGPVSRGKEKVVWDRFRTACDRFFRRRHEDLVQRKAMWSENLVKKEALCVSAEALAESTEWDQAAAELKRLQAEWRVVGPVKRTRSEAIWQRFRGACDRFFARYAHRHEVARAERIAAREVICAELEALAPAPPSDGAAEGAPSTPPPDLLQTVRALRSRWQAEIAARGVDFERARLLDERYLAASRQLTTRWPSAFAGSEVDPEANRRKMEGLVKRMEELAASITGAASAADDGVSPTTRLAAMLKDALAANTIGGRAEEEGRLRSAAEEGRQAQLAWTRIGHVDAEVKRQLTDRFHRAMARISDRVGTLGAPALSRGGRDGRPRGASR